MTVLSVRVRQSQKSRDSGTYCLIARGGGYGAETLPETAAPHRADFYTIVRSDGTVQAEGSPHTSVCSKADMAIKRKYKLSCQGTRHCTLDLRAFTPRFWFEMNGRRHMRECMCGVIRRQMQWGRTYIALMHTEIPCKHKFPLVIVHVNKLLHGKPVGDSRRLLHGQQRMSNSDKTTTSTA